MQPTFGGSIFFGSCATVRRDHTVDVDFKLNLSLSIKYWFPMTWLDDMWLSYSPVNWKASWFPVLNPIIARRLRRKITLFAIFLQTKWDFLLIFLKIVFLLHKSRQHWGFPISNTLPHPFFHKSALLQCLKPPLFFYRERSWFFVAAALTKFLCNCQLYREPEKF